MPDDRMVMPTRRLRAYFRGLRCLRPVIRTAMKISTSTTVAYRPCTALTHHILWLSSALSAKYAVLIHYATVVLTLQLHSMFQVRALCGDLMAPPPGRPSNDMGRFDAPLRQPCGDAADFLRRPVDEVWLRFRIIDGGGFWGGWRFA